MQLTNKKILLIAAKLFDYEIEIKNALKEKGAHVALFDQRPSNSFLMKVLIRLKFHKLIRKQINTHYSRISKQTKGIYFDYIFLISPEALNEQNLLMLIQENKQAKVIIYMWDSIKNKPHSLDLIKYADKCYSFDIHDSKNKAIEFLPLFYINEYSEVRQATRDSKYDITFIGTIHSDRYKIVKEVSKLAKNKNLTMHYYFYSPSKLLFLLQRLFFREFRNIDIKDVSYTSLKKAQVIDIIENSKCVIDIQHPSQTGLTMRSIEVLGAKRKLITTNRSIKSYDFFNSNNIFILDRTNITLSSEFLNSPYEALPSELYEKYSLNKWLDNIFLA